MSTCNEPLNNSQSEEGDVKSATARVRGRASQAKQRAKIDKSDLEHYFGQLTGTEEPDLDIVRPRLGRLDANTRDIILTMTEFSNVLNSIGYPKDADSIRLFINVANEFRELIEKTSGENLSGESWRIVKDHDFIQMCMVTCSKLSEIHTQFIHSWATVDRKFMNRYAGLVFKPMAPWCELDIKYLWLIDGESHADLREVIFTVLKNVFEAMRDIYDIYMSPDVDISHISEIIISTLGELKKQIPRCDKAFAQIERSAIMLKENFGEYYRDYLETKDPNNIFTAFISDVGQSCGDDTQLIFQCSRIVQFYKKNAQMKIASGEITGEKRRMFESLLNNYKVLERNASAQTGVNLGESQESSPPPATPEEDARDLDELMRQIENPRVFNISDNQKKTKKEARDVKP